MRNCFKNLFFCVVACILLAPVRFAGQAPAGAKAIPRAADGKPNLSGFWANAGPNWGFNSPRPKDSPPGPFDYHHAGQLAPMELTPWAKEQLLYNLDPLAREVGDGPEGRIRGRTELDPRMRCVPAGAYRLGLPQMIVQVPGKIFFFFDTDHERRQIFVDGRGHPKPEDLEFTWNGHSIGRWDGDTLVVDTVGMRDETWLDTGGRVHSTDLHMVERIRFIDSDTLEWETTLTDPKVFVKPFVERRTLKSRSNYDFTENIVCEEHYRKEPF